jgi:hypothetical protein
MSMIPKSCEDLENGIAAALGFPDHFLILEIVQHVLCERSKSSRGLWTGWAMVGRWVISNFQLAIGNAGEAYFFFCASPIACASSTSCSFCLDGEWVLRLGDDLLARDEARLYLSNQEAVQGHHAILGAGLDVRLDAEASCCRGSARRWRVC